MKNVVRVGRSGHSLSAGAARLRRRSGQPPNVPVAAGCRSAADRAGRLSAGGRRLPVHGAAAWPRARRRQRDARPGRHARRARSLLGRCARNAIGDAAAGESVQRQLHPAFRTQTLPTKDNALPMPTADAEFGIFKGIPLGLTNVGGIDVLVNASYIPTIDRQRSGRRESPNPASTKFGYGARVGILQESIVVPGVSVTWIKRDLPTTTIIGTGQPRRQHARASTT